MKLIIRKASARWKAGVRGGSGSVTTDSGVVEQARFESGIPTRKKASTNPMELIAAALACSFLVALSKELGKVISPGNIGVSATVTIERLNVGWTVINVHLQVLATLPNVTQSAFIDATIRAKTNCLISRLLHTNISMNAKLEKWSIGKVTEKNKETYVTKH
ncbi:MAG: osmC [Verrucomicrobiales bacterium]|nr:osmC [Verrucomicrobiales bacterium]